MKLTYFLSIKFVLLIFIASGCGNSVKTVENDASETGRLFQVTKNQFESEGMKIGEVTTRFFEDAVKCNGYIIAPANGMALISTPLSGIVETVNCSTGDYVRKGQVLCTLSSSEMMLLQLGFAETSAKLKRLTSDYGRSKSLFEENIGSEKDFIAIESDYRAMKSKYLSLKLRLERLKLDVSKIEAGESYAAFAVISPISGYITKLDLVLGQFAEQQKALMEIVDVNQLQLQLSVFENDVNKLETGQHLRFSLLGEPAFSHDATLASIGKTIDPESRTIQCVAKINDENRMNHFNHSYIEAMIIVNRSEGFALPGDALVKTARGYHVFTVEKYDDQRYYLRKRMVATGRISKDYIEILEGKDLAKVVVEGVYNLPDH